MLMFTYDASTFQLGSHIYVQHVYVSDTLGYTLTILFNEIFIL